MYYEDPIHGITKDQLRELLIGMANGIMPDTYGLKLIKLHKCAPRVLREMRLCREAGMTGDQIRPYWALGLEKLRGARSFPARAARSKCFKRYWTMNDPLYSTGCAY